MPFQEYAAFFEPNELDILTAAYDAVWQQIWTTSAMNETQTAVIKNNLVQIILASACTGERDIERLKEIAFRAVTSGRCARELELSYC